MQLNHAVLLTGYDSSSNWRIKNSWGVGWGDNGYIKEEQLQRHLQEPWRNGHRVIIYAICPHY